MSPDRAVCPGRPRRRSDRVQFNVSSPREASVDPTDEREATVRRFGRSDRSNEGPRSEARRGDFRESARSRVSGSPIHPPHPPGGFAGQVSAAGVHFERPSCPDCGDVVVSNPMHCLVRPSSAGCGIPMRHEIRRYVHPIGRPSAPPMSEAHGQSPRSRSASSSRLRPWGGHAWA
jgi:hypothetical protein